MWLDVKVSTLECEHDALAAAWDTLISRSTRSLLSLSSFLTSPIRAVCCAVSLNSLHCSLVLSRRTVRALGTGHPKSSEALSGESSCWPFQAALLASLFAARLLLLILRCAAVSIGVDFFACMAAIIVGGAIPPSLVLSGAKFSGLESDDESEDMLDPLFLS